MIYFLLPAFNEEKNIGIIISDIAKLFKAEEYSIILVNDGSTDRTVEIARNTAGKVNLKIVNHEVNLGLGNALKSGFGAVMGIVKNDDILIALDADNTHPLELTAQIIDRINSGSDIVIASRYCKGAVEKGLSFLRKIGSLVVNFIFLIFFRYPGVKDYTCGYRGYKGQFLLSLNKRYADALVTEPNFSAGTEILLKSFFLKPVISEIPLTLRYDLKQGKSKMKVVRTLLAYMKLIFKIKYLSFHARIW